MDTPASKPRSLLYWIGLVLIVLGLICPVFAVLVPLLNLSAGMAATVVGLLMVGVPEVFLVLGGALAGKELVDTLHGKMKHLLHSLGLSRPVGPVRYYTGVGLVLLGLLWSLVLDYLFLIQAVPMENNTRLYLLVTGDSLVIIGFFTAGRPFWVKLKRLFIWTPEEAACPAERGIAGDEPVRTADPSPG